MKRVRSILLASLMAFAMLVAPLMFNTTDAAAACAAGSSAKDCAKSGANATTDCNGPDGCPTLGDRITTIVNILLYILGAIAVIMIVVGGIRYTTSNGEASAITGAKNTILYAVVGLVVAILAYAIVNFVLGAF